MKEALNEELFTSRLADYDNALAQGQIRPSPFGDPLTSNPSPSGSGEAGDLESAKQCLELLEAVWPRAATGDRACWPAGAAREGTFHGDETLWDEPRKLGRFEIVRELGRGGGGIVFLARDPTLNRHVALKVPRAESLLTPALRRRFIRESETAAQLNHQHIVPIYEAGETEGICYLVSEYVEGPNLAQWQRDKEGPTPARQAALIVAALADGVAHMHSRGVLHRDIKPSNVLLQDATNSNQDAARREFTAYCVRGSKLEFVPRLTDFGLAKMDAVEAGNDATLADATRAGAVLGTPAYMAPEQAEGRLELLSPATDVYALGVVLYELLTGRPPFRGASDVDTLQQVATREVTAPRRLRRDVPRDIETICVKCLEKAPARRYPSAEALAEDLRRFLEGRPITARRVGRLERAVKWLRRRPLVTGMATITLAALGALVVLALRVPKAPPVEGPNDPARNALYSQTMRKASKLYQDNGFSRLGEVLRDSLPEPGQPDVRSFEWHYLWRLAKRGYVLRGHGAPPERVAFSADGRLCATGSGRDRKIIVWDLTQGRSIAEFRISTKRVESLSFTEDDARLVATQDEKTRHTIVHVWDVANSKLLVEQFVPWHSGHMTVSRDGRKAAGIFDSFDPSSRFTGAELQVAALDGGTPRLVFQPEGNDMHRPCFSPDGRLIAFGYRHVGPSQAYILDMNKGAPLATYQTAGGYLSRFCFAPDGKRLALGTSGGEGAIWDWAVNQAVRFQEEGGIWELEFDRNGSVLALGTAPEGKRTFNMTVRLRDARTGEHIRDIARGGLGISAFALSADGKMIGLCGDDNLLHLQELNPAPAEVKLPPPAPSGEAWAVAFSPKGDTLAAGYDNEEGKDAETLKLWDPLKKTARVLAGHEATVMALAYSPDGATLATAGFDQKVGLWNAADGKLVGWLEGHTKPVRAVAFSPDGRLLASGGSDQTIMLTNVAERKRIASWIAHTHTIRALAFAPDGRRLASASNDESTSVWDVQTQTNLFTLPDEHNASCLSYSPDGTALATGNERCAVKLWDAANGKLKQTLKGHTGKLRALAFAPNGRTLATGGEDNVVRLWSVTTGEELLALSTEHFINSLAFDRRGSSLAAALHDGSVKNWSAESR